MMNGIYLELTMLGTMLRGLHILKRKIKGHEKKTESQRSYDLPKITQLEIAQSQFEQQI
jgi:hypothetical protein